MIETKFSNGLVKKVLLAIFAVLLIVGTFYFSWFKLINNSNGGHPSPESLGQQGISGIVLLGPTCPVMSDPPDPQCADKPYKTTLAITTADGARVIKQVSSDESGKFHAELPPGEYAIRSAAAANILPYCASNGAIRVDANIYTETTVYCDTGIR